MSKYGNRTSVKAPKKWGRSGPHCGAIKRLPKAKRLAAFLKANQEAMAEACGEILKRDGV
jgi:hypothetical protein